jgi:hypothetical protein
MNFQTNVNAVVRAVVSFQRKIDRATSEKWKADSRTYVNILRKIETMLADGVPIETIKKALYADFKQAIVDNPDAESEVKAFRAAFRGFFEDEIFGTGMDWAEYVASFETQDAWRKAHRKTGKARAGKGEGGKGDAEQVADAPKTDPERVAAMLATLSGCDDIPGAVAAFIEGASALIVG